MKKILWTALCGLLAFLPFAAQGQFVPSGSSQYSFQTYGHAGSSECPYIMLGSYRVLPPFIQQATNMVMDQQGELVWYGQEPFWALDFKVHANGKMAYNDNIRWHVLDSNFAEVDTVQCIGYQNDPHDMIMTADGHYFLICIEDTVVDLTTLLTVTTTPGALNATMECVVIQELDGGKNVVREWHGKDHYVAANTDSVYFQNPSVLQLNHTNSLEWNGSKMLVSHRALNEICLIDWASGAIDWHLGGKLNQFDLQGNAPTIGQHDARFLPNGRISTFDNGNRERPARSLVWALDTVAMTAAIEWSYSNPLMMSDAMGSFRKLPDGSALTGFGRPFPTTEPVVSYIAADSSKIFDIRFTDSSSTYRVQCTDFPFGLHRPKLNCQQSAGQVVLGVDGIHTQYEWTTGENTATIVVADTGWYQVFVPRGVGMMSTPRVHITDLANACLSVPVDPARESPRIPKLIGVFDLLGRPADDRASGMIYLERYSDGSSRKVVRFE